MEIVGWKMPAGISRMVGCPRCERTELVELASRLLELLHSRLQCVFALLIRRQCRRKDALHEPISCVLQTVDLDVRDGDRECRVIIDL